MASLDAAVRGREGRYCVHQPRRTGNSNHQGRPDHPIIHLGWRRTGGGVRHPSLRATAEYRYQATVPRSPRKSSQCSI